jgi:outer membrane lipoprotein-sorting protein
MSGSTNVRVVLALVLAVSLAGCGAANLPFLGDDVDDDGQAEQIAADAVGEMQSASAYNFTMTQVVGFGQNEVNMTAEGTVNHATERLYMDVTESVLTNTTRSKEFTEVYVVDDTRCRSDRNADSGWSSTNASALWNQGLSADSQASLLNASGTSAVLRENRTVRGEPAYVVEVRPDAAALKRVVVNSSDADLSAVTVQNATLTQYVSQDDNRLLRSTMHVTFVQEGRPTTVDLNMTYSDYGDVPPITVPENDDGDPVCP